MKKGWEVKRLGDVVSFQRGLTYSKKDEVDLSSNIVLRANNIDLRTNTLDFSELKYINDDLTIRKEKKVTKGSLIICTASGSKSHLGKIALIDDDYDYAFGGFMGQLNPSNNIDSKYLFHLLTSDAYKTFINKLSDGVNINNLRFDDLSAFPTPLPPLPEQKRIVGILDKVFAAIATAKANAEKNLQNARELFESYLQGVFAKPGDGWEKNTLGEIAIVQSGGTPLRSTKKYWENGDIPWYSSGELNDLYTTESERRITIIGLNNSNAKLFSKGSLLIGMYDTAALKMSIIDRDAAFNQAIAGVKPNKKLNLIFVLHAINAIKPELLRQRRGVRQKNLSLEKIKDIILSIPPLPEQKRIVAKLDALSVKTKKFEAIYQQKLADLDELKKSVLQKAFNGELPEVKRGKNMNEAETRAEHIGDVRPKKLKVKLYKFRPLADEQDFDRLKRILETGEFWCSQFLELNDPMEGVFYGQKEDVGVIYNEKNKYKICSFSHEEAFENPAMWGYYANAFKGMAIKIEVNESNVKIIDYVDEIPSLKELTVDNKIVKILTTKSIPWKNEEEYRFLKKSENNYHKVGKITGVYFGNPYGDVANRREIEIKSKSLSEYKKFKEKLIKFAKVKGIKVYHVKIEGCKVKEARIDIPAKNS